MMRWTMSALYLLLALAAASAAEAQTTEPVQKTTGQMPVAQGAIGQGQAPGVAPCGMMGQGQGMMSPSMGRGMTMGPMTGGMMGREMTPCGMVVGAMPPKARGCMELSCRMMDPSADATPLQQALALTDDQVEKLRTTHRPFQKEAVRLGASLRIAEMDVADLLGAEDLDTKKIESKFREIEKIRTELAMNHVNALAAVRKTLTKDQVEALGKMSPCGGPCGGAPCGQQMPCGQGAPCMQQPPPQGASQPGTPEPAPENQHH